jgi:hypothetical protein
MWDRTAFSDTDCVLTPQAIQIMYVYFSAAERSVARETDSLLDWRPDDGNDQLFTCAQGKHTANRTYFRCQV